MSKLFFLLLGLLCSTVVSAQRFFHLKGKVKNDEQLALVGANLRDIDFKTGTQTDSHGEFDLFLEEGYHRLSVSFLGYQTQSFEIEIKKNEYRDFILLTNENILSEIKVNVKKKDFSYEIIRNVIENKANYLNQYQNYQCKTYIKSIEEVVSSKKDDLNKTDHIPNWNFYEAVIDRFEALPNKHKEIRNAVKKLGDQQNLYFASSIANEIDLYRSTQNIPSLGENALVSPISPLGFISYKFELLDTFNENGYLIYRIGLRGKSLGNALFEGEIEVIDKLWVIKNVSLAVPKKLLIFYDDFSFSQHYELIQGKWVITTQEYKWKIKQGSGFKIGRTNVNQSDFFFDTIYHKNFFGDQLSQTMAEAYKKDSVYWKKNRSDALNEKEIGFLKNKELEEFRLNSKEYLDSLDEQDNKLTFLKFWLKGLGKTNRTEKTQWNSLPFIVTLNPLGVGTGGWRINQGFSWNKKYANRRIFNLNTNLNYGLLNKDLMGSTNTFWLYNPVKRSSLDVSVRKGIDLINPFATISDYTKRSNIYINTGLNVGHRTELINGLYLNSGIRLNRRNDLRNYEFSSFGNKLIDNNEGSRFPTSHVLKVSAKIEYTPHQLYMSEPYEKVILGSKYPTFSLEFSQAFIPKSGLKLAFNQAELQAKQYFNFGILGTSEYRISLSKFFNRRGLAPMDYKYQRGGDSYWFSPSMYTFQLLPKTIITLDWALESHYEHQFNGLLTSKIPLINKTGIRSLAGAGLLYSPENNTQYSEIYGGINRIFTLYNFSFRLGAYYVAAQSNQFGFRSGFKFSFEPYNKLKKNWSF